MAASPVPVLVILALTLTFEAALFGGEMAATSIPAIHQPESGDCSGFIDGALCQVRLLADILKVTFSVIVIFLRLLTFDIPGAPAFLRILLSTMMIGGISWSVATIVRGT